MLELCPMCLSVARPFESRKSSTELKTIALVESIPSVVEGIEVEDLRVPYIVQGGTQFSKLILNSAHQSIVQYLSPRPKEVEKPSRPWSRSAMSLVSHYGD
jgi:uncharacterized membrane protein (UPF0182 family)